MLCFNEFQSWKGVRDIADLTQGFWFSFQLEGALIKRKHGRNETNECLLNKFIIKNKPTHSMYVRIGVGL